ncbi:MAG: two-component sensor histidine kinase [Deltaproteobacteria bacterium]|nr:two-component sensor histidine kinase [Deltaproteobacteria bacterium]
MDEKNQPTSNFYRLLKRNILLTIILVSVTPMIIVSGIILVQFHISYQKKVRIHLETLVNKHKLNIDFFLKEKLADIRFIIKNFSIEQLSDESFLQDELKMLQEEFGPVFVDLGVINPDGTQVAYAGPFKLGKADYSSADWFQGVMKSRYFISDVFLGLRGLPHFIIAVRESYQGKSWILRSTIDFVAFNNLVENIRIGKTGFAFIVNRKGKFQTKPLFDVTQGKGPYMDFVKNSKTSKNNIYTVAQKDESGINNIYVAAFLKNGDWLLVFQQKSSDAYSDFSRTLDIALVIILLGALSIITMAIILSKRMVRRVSKVDREKQMMNKQVVETGKLASIGELASGIAHEINNPVAIMVEEAGWIEDLLEEEDLKQSENLDEFLRALQQIRTQGKRCKGITHKLLSFARETDSRIQEVQVNDLIREIVSISEQRAKYNNILINTHLQEELPFILASQSELQQVMLNLINNANDAMEDKGGAIDITSMIEDNSMVIKVADTGPGIPAVNLSRIFDPFFTTKPVGKGTGLGLSICFGIINKMGGEMKVESKVGMGTTFYIKIPLKKTDKGRNTTTDKNSQAA